MQASLPLRFGGDTLGSGDLRLALFRRLRPQIGSKTGIALLGRLRLPTGRGSAGVDPSLKFISDRGVGGSGPTQSRLLFNFSLGLNASRRDDERSAFYRIVGGYSRKLGPRTTLLFDLSRAQERARDDRLFVAEVGARRELSARNMLGLGAGFSLDSRSLDLLLRASIERSF